MVLHAQVHGLLHGQALAHLPEPTRLLLLLLLYSAHLNLGISLGGKCFEGIGELLAKRNERFVVVASAYEKVRVKVTVLKPLTHLFGLEGTLHVALRITVVPFVRELRHRREHGRDAEASRQLLVLLLWRGWHMETLRTSGWHNPTVREVRLLVLLGLLHGHLMNCKTGHFMMCGSIKPWVLVPARLLRLQQVRLCSETPWTSKAQGWSIHGLARARCLLSRRMVNTILECSTHTGISSVRKESATAVAATGIRISSSSS
mmetsp:Transcript_2848/g.6642  ORF Transcript_2848/g.6642 Transcript_2848/m.6642 type:complete len:260 (+) Transcript_2848:2021-2800(+)